MRPSTPITPGPGQESVWDYPRPPRVERSTRRIVIEFGGVIVDTTDSVRVLETSHPPVYYVPIEAVTGARLVRTAQTSFCEFKGVAGYYDLEVGGRRSPAAAWFYETPDPGYESLGERIAFYPARVDAVFLDGAPVMAQEGGYYGGWITPDIVGPFKGAPGTRGW